MQQAGHAPAMLPQWARSTINLAPVTQAPARAAGANSQAWAGGRCILSYRRRAQRRPIASGGLDLLPPRCRTVPAAGRRKVAGDTGGVALIVEEAPVEEPIKAEDIPTAPPPPSYETLLSDNKFLYSLVAALQRRINDNAAAVKECARLKGELQRLEKVVTIALQSKGRQPGRPGKE